MKRSVLVVDDDDSSRFVLAEILKGLGFHVVSAEDGAEVPELLLQHRFDLLVVDLYMSGMNGFELLRRIRRPEVGVLSGGQTSSRVPILVVSGESQPASIANARRLGADAYLVKPVDVDELASTVTAVLSGKDHTLS